MPGFYRWENSDLILAIRVQPRARSNAIDSMDADSDVLRLRLTAPPVDGKANTALKKYLGKIFGVAPANIELLSGQHSRSKRLRIHAPTRLPDIIHRPG